LFGSTGFAADLLIFSPTHDPQSSTEEPAGVLEVVVSSFEPLQAVSINSKAVALSDEYSAEIFEPLSLQKGGNSFLVEVVTATQTKKVTYQIELLDPEVEKGVKDPFSMLSMAGLHSLDNATNAPSSGTKEGALKFQFLVKPSYKLNEADAVYGMMLREKYSPASLASREIVMTQVGATSYIKGHPFEVGISDIGVEMSGLSAKTKLETDLFFKGEHQFSWMKASVDLTYRNMDAKPTNGQQDGDGLRLILKGDYPTTLAGYKSNLFTSFENMDAKGKYKDRIALRAGLKAKDKIQGINVTAGIDFKQSQNTAADETGVKESTLLTTLNFGGSYSLDSLHKGLLGLASLKYTTQGSNVDAKKYSATDLGISLIHNF